MSFFKRKKNNEISIPLEKLSLLWLEKQPAALNQPNANISLSEKEDLLSKLYINYFKNHDSTFLPVFNDLKEIIEKQDEDYISSVTNITNEIIEILKTQENNTLYAQGIITGLGHNIGSVITPFLETGNYVMEGVNYISKLLQKHKITESKYIITAISQQNSNDIEKTNKIAIALKMAIEKVSAEKMLQETKQEDKIVIPVENNIDTEKKESIVESKSSQTTEEGTGQKDERIIIPTEDSPEIKEEESGTVVNTKDDIKSGEENEIIFQSEEILENPDRFLKFITDHIDVSSFNCFIWDKNLYLQRGLAKKIINRNFNKNLEDQEIDDLFNSLYSQKSEEYRLKYKDSSVAKKTLFEIPSNLLESIEIPEEKTLTPRSGGLWLTKIQKIKKPETEQICV